MKKYVSPEAELLAFASMDIIMSSNPNETPQDSGAAGGDLNIQDI